MAAALLLLSFLFGSTYVVNIRGVIKFLGVVITQALKAVSYCPEAKKPHFIPAEINTVFYNCAYKDLC